MAAFRGRRAWAVLVPLVLGGLVLAVAGAARLGAPPPARPPSPAAVPAEAASEVREAIRAAREGREASRAEYEELRRRQQEKLERIRAGDWTGLVERGYLTAEEAEAARAAARVR